MHLPIFDNPVFKNLPPATSIVKNVGLRDFKQEVFEVGRPVLVDFWGEGCAPCRMVASVLEKFAKENAAVKVVKVNIGQEPELAGYFKIDVVPTLIIFNGNKTAIKAVGVVNKEQLAQMLTAVTKE